MFAGLGCSVITWTGLVNVPIVVFYSYFPKVCAKSAMIGDDLGCVKVMGYVRGYSGVWEEGTHYIVCFILAIFG